MLHPRLLLEGLPVMTGFPKQSARPKATTSCHQSLLVMLSLLRDLQVIGRLCWPPRPGAWYGHDAPGQELGLVSTHRSLYWQEAYTDWTGGSSVPSLPLQKLPSLICSQMSLVCPSLTFLTG